METRTASERAIEVRVGQVLLLGDLFLSDKPCGVIVFAHGSGSSRQSPRNRFVAQELQRAGCSTLLLDLLTVHEETVDRETGHFRFDIPLLADRLAGTVDWLGSDPQTASLPVGCFGASTGAAAALVTAALRPRVVHAVVSRGGRPDLADYALPRVLAPTLLIVGGNDSQILRLNEKALETLPGGKRLEIIPGATHLFEEPGALERVAALAVDWFLTHLRR